MEKDIKKIYDTMSNLFKLVHKLEDESIYKSEFDDISRAEIHTITAIGTGRPKTMTHVANILEINVSSLTTAINKLVKKGYVQRLRDDKDRRIVKIGLTDKGIAAVEEHDSFMENMVKDAVSIIPSDKQQYFVSAIENINSFFMAQSSMIYVKNSPFKLNSLNLGTHKLPVPIVQAGMSIGIAGAGLASAVAIEGGLGLIGTSEIGYKSELYRKDRHKANIEAVKSAVKEAREKLDEAGGNGLIGATVMWNNLNAHKYAEAAVKSGAQVIVTSGGIPKDLPKYCDKKTALIPTISSKRAASAIIRSWSQKYNRVPDGFILQDRLPQDLWVLRKSRWTGFSRNGIV